MVNLSHQLDLSLSEIFQQNSLPRERSRAVERYRGLVVDILQLEKIETKIPGLSYIFCLQIVESFGSFLDLPSFSQRRQGRRQNSPNLPNQKLKWPKGSQKEETKKKKKKKKTIFSIQKKNDCSDLHTKNKWNYSNALFFRFFPFLFLFLFFFKEKEKKKKKGSVFQIFQIFGQKLGCTERLVMIAQDGKIALVFLLSISLIFPPGDTNTNPSIPCDRRVPDNAPESILIGSLIPFRPGPNPYNTSFFMAIDSINADECILPGTTLLGVANATNPSPVNGLRAFLDQVQILQTVVNIGAGSSGISRSVAIASPLFETPQISYASTLAELSKKETYPYFNRVVPSDVFQVRVPSQQVGRDL